MKTNQSCTTSLTGWFALLGCQYSQKNQSFLQSVFTQSLENVFFTRQTSALNISDHRQWDPLMCLTTVPFVRTSADITYLNESTLIAWNYPCVWYISAASVLTLGVPIRWSPQRNSRAKLAVIFYHTGVKEKCDHYYLLQKKKKNWFHFICTLRSW